MVGITFIPGFGCGSFQLDIRLSGLEEHWAQVIGKPERTKVHVVLVAVAICRGMRYGMNRKKIPWENTSWMVHKGP